MILAFTTYTRGLMAEIYTMAFLVMKGYRILAWRYKTPVGEIDVVAKRGAVIVFVEVKLRAGLDDAVTPRMQQRISRASGLFMAGHRRFSGCFPRFDVVAVSGLRLRHLDNAWQCTT
jgi:putative endonuclease